MALDRTFVAGEILSAGDVNGHLLGLWIPIDKRVVTSGAPTTPVTFSSLDSNFRFFRLTYHVIPSAGLRLRLNNDSGATYAQQTNEGYNATNVGVRVTGANAFDIDRGGTASTLQGQIIISKISATTEARAQGTLAINAHATIGAALITGSWNNTSSLINRIDVLGNAGTFYGVVALEGMRGV